MARRREQWKKFQGRPDPARLVFVDETWAKTNMAPLRGWAPVGQRLHAKVPYGHWKTMTFIAALRCDRIDAPFVFDQPINAASFTAWVEEQLCPTLGPGDIVILDNLSTGRIEYTEGRIYDTWSLENISADNDNLADRFARTYLGVTRELTALRAKYTEQQKLLNAAVHERDGLREMLCVMPSPGRRQPELTVKCNACHHTLSIVTAPPDEAVPSWLRGMGWEWRGEGVQYCPYHGALP